MTIDDFELQYRYELSESNPAVIMEAFAVDPTSGHVNILKDVLALKEEGVEFPVQVMLVAMDNPNDVSDALTATTVLKVIPTIPHSS